jgi:hypothetical protein
MPLRMRLDELIATVCFGIAGAIGLIGAFIGLQVSSFWTDELITAWVIGADNSVPHMLGRALTDVHPPIYYTLSFAYSQLAGHSDAALRLLSALLACAAIIVFTAATGRAFSLPARLFGAAMATGSSFWFYQSQNARDYTLCLVIGSILLAISIHLLLPRSRDRRPPIWTILSMVALMSIGSFVHFYVFFECLAILLVLATYLPKQRIVFICTFLVLSLAAEAYTKLVIERYTEYSLTHTWITGGLVWYTLVLAYTVRSTVNILAIVGLAICATAYALGRSERQLPKGSAAEGENEWSWEGLPAASHRLLGVVSDNRVVILCSSVPLIVVVAGVSTSIVISPNITDRNILVCSPFIWGLFAKAYDFGVPSLRLAFRRPANIALAAVVLSMSTIVAARALPRNEPYRESAAWIRSFPKCRGQEIPVIYSDKKDRAEPGWTQLLMSSVYGHYLGGFARPRVVYLEDITGGKLPLDVEVEIKGRIDGHGCQVVGWNTHALSADDSMAITNDLLTAVGATAAARVIHVRSFSVYEPRLTGFAEEPSGYVFYLDDGPDRSPAPPPERGRVGMSIFRRHAASPASAVRQIL